jgi:hypothetical protein
MDVIVAEMVGITVIAKYGASTVNIAAVLTEKLTSVAKEFRI